MNPFMVLGMFQATSSVASSISQASAIKAQASWEASQYERNARLADFYAEEEIKAGDRAASERNKATKKLVGSQRAALAAQGIEVNANDALDIQAETADMGALDALNIKNNAWRKAWGYRVEASNLRSSSNFTRISGKYNARTTLMTGGLNAAENILSGYALSKQKR